MNEKEMTERYIYEVIKRVPQETREEIRLELQSLIEDMCAEEGAPVEEVLKKLGDPAEFAKQYRDTSNYLIGPEYYDNYMWVLKLALIGIGISAVLSAFVNAITEVENLTKLFTSFFTDLFTTAITGTYSAVGIVTIVFAVLEWQKVKVNLKTKKDWTVDELSKNATSTKTWSPLSLPPVPDKRALISRGDSVAGIIFISAFAAILLFAPQLFGAFHYDGQKINSVACVFNLAEWNRILPVFLLCLFAGLVDEIIRLVMGYHCKVVMVCRIICDAVQMVGAAVLLKVLPFWNPDFTEQLQTGFGVNSFSKGDILFYWGADYFNNIILAFICLISLLEIGVTVYKTLRYA